MDEAKKKQLKLFYILIGIMIFSMGLAIASVFITNNYYDKLEDNNISITRGSRFWYGLVISGIGFLELGYIIYRMKNDKGVRGWYIFLVVSFSASIILSLFVTFTPLFSNLTTVRINNTGMDIDAKIDKIFEDGTKNGLIAVGAARLAVSIASLFIGIQLLKINKSETNKKIEEQQIILWKKQQVWLEAQKAKKDAELEEDNQ